MKSMQVIAVCLVAVVSYAVAKPQVPLDTPEVAAAKAAHFAAHYAARAGYPLGIHPYISPVIPAALPYIAAAHAVADQSGAYVHDPTGDVAAPYLHDPSGDYAAAYAYALPYAAPVIVNGVPVDTPEVAAAKVAHLAAHAALG